MNPGSNGRKTMLALKSSFAPASGYHVPPVLPSTPAPSREPCPPGACTCDREKLLDDPGSDTRVLMLTKDQEKKLIARIETISNYADLTHIQELIHSQLGVVLQITPSIHGVRTVRGLTIQLAPRPGLCRKTRQSVPAAIRRCLEQNPQIVYALLDAHDLLGPLASHDMPVPDTRTG